jgi:hypothetical protein
MTSPTWSDLEGCLLVRRDRVYGVCCRYHDGQRESGSAVATVSLPVLGLLAAGLSIGAAAGRVASSLTGAGLVCGERDHLATLPVDGRDVMADLAPVGI